MAVEVTPTVFEADVERHDDGIKWHIDEHHALHVVGSSGNVAAYSPGCWASVRLVNSPSD